MKDVNIAWTLYDDGDNPIEISDSMSKTDSDGLTIIKLKVDGNKFQSVQNNQLYKLKIKPAKETISNSKIIDHTFLCDNESIACVDNSANVYLKHLDFDKVVNFADDTSVPITGKVIVEGTADNSESTLGCPIKGAKVCLRRKLLHNFVDTDICSDTDGDGIYELPATIGTIISLRAQYLNHTVSSVLEKKEELEDGIDIVPHKPYTGFDFEDVDKTYMVIDMAGGLCNKTLGVAEFKLKINGCDWTQSLTQDKWQEYHLVPKQLLNLKVEKISHETGELHETKAQLGETIIKDFRGVDESRLKHHERLGTGPCTVDVYEDETELIPKDKGHTAELCEKQCKPLGVGFQFNNIEKRCNCIKNDREPKMIAKGEDENTVCYEQTRFENEDNRAASEKRKDEVFGTDHTIRFQYDGNLVIDEATIEEDEIGNASCSSKNLEKECNNSDKQCSMSVIKTGKMFTAKVTLKRELVPGVVFCDVIDEATSVRIMNNVGLDAVDDVDHIKKLNEIGIHKNLLELVTKCTSGCNGEVTHDINGETNAMSGARVEETFVAGFPTINDPYYKLLIVTLNNDKSHSFQIVVTGDKNIAGGKSFGFPTHHPLLVIRDPVSLF